MATKSDIETELAGKKTRLQLYLDCEAKILSGGTQAYGYGQRSVTKYNAELAVVRTVIKELEDKISELEGKLTGSKPRKAVGIIPRDL